MGNGLAKLSGYGGPRIADSLNYPTGIVMDTANNIYIANSCNNRIRKLITTTGTINNIANNGIYGFWW